MWNLFLRFGMMLSTALLGKQLFDRVWPTEIHPTRLYRPHQIARYMGTTTDHVLHLVRTGNLPARSVSGEPAILGIAVLQYLSRGD